VEPMFFFDGRHTYYYSINTKVSLLFLLILFYNCASEGVRFLLIHRVPPPQLGNQFSILKEEGGNVEI